jgi:hypothetical protein
MNAQRLIVRLALGLAVLTAALGATPVAAGGTRCPDGSARCVNRTIAQLQKRYDVEAPACDHNVMFTLSYLFTTQAYRDAVRDPNFFNDNAWVNIEDWVFAKMYTDAAKNWAAGRRGQVPEAWRIAFSAADQRLVNGTGDLLLGINAHVNRDLPFALYQMGLTAPDGSSRKPDHDRVNVILEQVEPKILQKLHDNFDPTVMTTVVQGTTIDDHALFQLLVAWRENAWWNAVRLVTAPTPAARAVVAQSIEDQATAEANSLELATLYTPPLTSTGPRDAYCAVHWND